MSGEEDIHASLHHHYALLGVLLLLCFSHPFPSPLSRPFVFPQQDRTREEANQPWWLIALPSCLQSSQCLMYTRNVNQQTWLIVSWTLVEVFCAVFFFVVPPPSFPLHFPLLSRRPPFLPLLGAVCKNHPKAECRANYCGGCNADFFLGLDKLTNAQCEDSEGTISLRRALM